MYFAAYVQNGGSSVAGLYGTVGAAGAIGNSYAGDILQIRDSEGTYYHTYIVTTADLSSSPRTNAQLWVSAHTANRNNENLYAVLGAGQSNLRLIVITGNKY